MMKNPSHPGLLVKDCLDELGLSSAEAAGSLGMSPLQLEDLIAGRFDIAPEFAERLEKTMGGTAETWLRMQKQHDEAAPLKSARRGMERYRNALCELAKE